MKKPIKRGAPKRRKSARKRVRNHPAEYARRKERGLAAGKTVSQARGHARAGERPKPEGPQHVLASRAEEKAIRMIAKGSTLRAAAREHGLSEERVRRHLKENVSYERKGKRWWITDLRPRQFPFYSEGHLVHPTVTPEQASEAARYMHAVRRSLPTGNAKALQPFVGRGVIDVHGNAHAFEVDLNMLYELDAAGELSFPEIYKIVS